MIKYLYSPIVSRGQLENPPFIDEFPIYSPVLCHY